MPKIDRLDVSVYEVPLDAPQSDGTFTWTSTTVVVAEASARGVTGLGFSYATAACAPLMRDVLFPAVFGGEALDPPRSWREMVAAIRNIGRPGVASMSIAAVDIALWDLKARLLDLPLVHVLGSSHDDVAVYGSGGFTSMTDAELTAQLEHWVFDLDIPRVKIKIGTAWGSLEARDRSRVSLARRVVGDATELYVDANGAYRRKQAVRLGSEFAGEGVTWFEEPVSSDDLDGLATVRHLFPGDVAAGEYGYDIAYFDRMCRAGAVDVVQIDVSRCAGITEWLRVAALAAGFGLDVSAHCAPSLHVHPACAVPNIRHVEYFADHVAVDHVLFDNVRVPVHGRLSPDLTSTGMGLELRRADAERYRRDI